MFYLTLQSLEEKSFSLVDISTRTFSEYYGKKLLMQCLSISLS